MSRTLLTIKEGSEFLAQAEKIAGSIKRWDEIVYGVTWAISRGPGHFPIVFEPAGIRVAKILSRAQTPPLRIFFTSDENEAVLRWVEKIPLDEIEDDEE